MTTTRGDFAGTDAVLGRAARLFAELGDPVGRSWLRGTTAFARLLAGRLHESRRLARIFLPFGDRVGEGWAVGTLRAVEAYAAAELGDLAEADGEARRAYRDFAAVADDWGRGLRAGGARRDRPRAGRARPRRRTCSPTRWRTPTGPATRCCSAWPARCAASWRCDRGDVEAAEADARRVMTAVEPHNPLAAGPGRAAGAAGRGPAARPATPRTAVGLLAPIASDTGAPSLLFSRRHALASYASALLADGRVEAALTWIRRAREVPAEDVRSGVVAAMVLARVLAAAGRVDEAAAAARGGGAAGVLDGAGQRAASRPRSCGRAGAFHRGVAGICRVRV